LELNNGTPCTINAELACCFGIFCLVICIILVASNSRYSVKQFGNYAVVRETAFSAVVTVRGPVVLIPLLQFEPLRFRRPLQVTLNKLLTCEFSERTG